MRTTTVKTTAPQWFIVDAAGQSLGRISAKIAMVLRGKHKPSFSPHQLCGDHVIVLNVEKLDVTPSKGRRKTYYRHTGHTSGLRVASLTQMMERDPEGVMTMSVKGMLAKTRLRPLMLKRLHVFQGGEHPYAAQKPATLNLSTL